MIYKKVPLKQVNVTDCRGCGVCCTYMGGTPVVSYLGHAPQPEDAARKKDIPPELLAEMQGMLAEWDAHGFLPDEAPCVWYDADKKLCRNHQHRPEVCREFEVGGSGCQRVRRLFGIDPMKTYGISKGRMVVKVSKPTR
jgi:Fe-S-cluster containining protein